MNLSCSKLGESEDLWKKSYDLMEIYIVSCSRDSIYVVGSTYRISRLLRHIAVYDSVAVLVLYVEVS